MEKLQSRGVVVLKVEWVFSHRYNVSFIYPSGEIFNRPRSTVQMINKSAHVILEHFNISLIYRYKGIELSSAFYLKDIETFKERFDTYRFEGKHYNESL